MMFLLLFKKRFLPLDFLCILCLVCGTTKAQTPSNSKNAVVKPVTLSYTPQKIKASKLTGITVDTVWANIDTAVKKNPLLVYATFELKNIKGSNLLDIGSGKKTFFIYSDKGVLVPMNDIVLYKTKGSLEGSIVNLTLKIPVKPKTDTKSARNMTFVWQSPDTKKSFELQAVVP